MAAVTLDTGVFIALERKRRRALVLWKAWERAGITLTVPAVVIAEWWRELPRFTRIFKRARECRRGVYGNFFGPVSATTCSPGNNCSPILDMRY